MNDTITIARRVASPQSAFDEARTEWPDRPTLTWWTIDRPVLVLGSAQPMSIVDLGAAARAGVEVVRRCSGGGAVLLAPNDVVWADLVISPTDTRWSDDIVVAAHWVGDAWRSALIDLGVQEQALFLHAGRSVRTRWSDLVCFAGLGPGELTLGGRKVLGIAQRRSRAGARFQMALLRRWEPTAIVDLLVLGPSERREAESALNDIANGIDFTVADIQAAAEGFLAIGSA